ncbi:hypothetical protein HKCCE4037_19110 [Rhodobacterales bacterium HKCCE4037]|nr:hypothetical protein [Rhodobacterales bacterium HKCCE4037]
MAKTQTKSPKTSPKAPTLIAWQVTKRSDKSYWTKLGAAWSHKDGNGFTIQLDAVPIDCRILLRQPIEDPAEPAIEKEGA